MGSCAAPSAKGDDKFITTDYLQQCRISYNAVRKMEEKGVLPRTDYTEETSYSKILADNSNGKITKEWLLDKANPKHLQTNKPS
ncbi:hypothetical protein QZK17_12140 [Acinetobacter baumannii]|nr:hypothetical protein [Acinetobacter baumannii]